MRLIYEGTDITRKVAINRCEHETYAESHADTLLLRFSDAASKWDGWQPRRGDKVQVTEGAANTGTMYISGLTAQNGLFTLRATSMPLTGENVGSQTWDNVRLFQLGGDIAKKHGLSFKPYGVTNQLYPFIRQGSQTDFEFLNLLCQLEGYAVVIYDKALIIYDEHARESGEAAADVRVGADGRFTYTDNSAQAYGMIELTSGALRGSFSDQSAPAERVLRTKSPIDCMSTTEAQRFARGILRQANKNAFVGSFRRRLMADVAAASVLNLITEKASNWSGKIFVTRTRNDFVRGESKIFFRKPLEGY